MNQTIARQALELEKALTGIPEAVQIINAQNEACRRAEFFPTLNKEAMKHARTPYPTFTWPAVSDFLREKGCRMCYAMIQEKPGVDLNAILTDGRRQKFLEDEGGKAITGEMVAKSELVNMGKRFVDVQMSNVELEQDIAILRKKFRDLLTAKGQP